MNYCDMLDKHLPKPHPSINSVYLNILFHEHGIYFMGNHNVIYHKLLCIMGV